MSADKTKESKANKTLTQEQIVSGFQELRNQQRSHVEKIAELTNEIKEHEIVIEALKEVDPSRKCFRMIGGVLVERTVADVLPALMHNHEQLGKIIVNYEKQLETKGKELLEYRQKHNIRIRGEDDKKFEPSGSEKSTGVLVPAGKN